jgi:DNA mismatch repair protein MSH6
MCKPEFIKSSTPYLHLEKMRHPILASRISNFVPNDTTIGIVDSNDVKSSILITGPNMGGKSTILRQTCIAVLMAQIGCFVPAEKCVLTVVDRIFTRIGARDRILEGKSTFFIEMEEIKTVIDHATVNSLIIVDELGRGTSTNEGMVISKSILEYISTKIKCRNLFTTHYHDLVDACKHLKGVDLFHLDCNVDDKNQSVNFLYKFVKGVCPKSYGINVARLAGIKVSKF